MAKQTDRKTLTPNMKASLLMEVSGKCPLSRTPLIERVKHEDGSLKKVVNQYEVAHIYPLHPTEIEVELLSGEELLTDDIDSLDNMIPLCKPCHKRYDTQKTVAEYRGLLGMKKEILKLSSFVRLWGGQGLYEDVVLVAKKVLALDEGEIKSNVLSYKALEVSKKADKTLGLPSLFKIEAFVVNYYPSIKKVLRELEEAGDISCDVLYAQVKFAYLALKKEGFDQDKIFNHMTDWFMGSVALGDRSKAEVFTSYFVQNCEVFSDTNSK